MNNKEQKKLYFTKMGIKTPFLKRALWETYGKKCVYCGLELMVKDMEIDHLWPRKPAEEFNDPDLIEFEKEIKERGFVEDSLENYILSCKNCNGVKKNNRSLGVSNFRFYYSFTFKNRDKVQKKITQYTTERGEDFKEGNKKIEKGPIEQYNLDVEKRVSYSYDLMHYVWGKGHAYIQAFVPLDYTETLACLICTEELEKSRLSYTLSNEEMKENLFVGIGLPVDKRPWCMHFNPEEGGAEYNINLPNIRFEASSNEVNELAEIIDDLYDVYMLQDARIRDILGITNFKSKQTNKVRLAEISEALWNEIVWFAQQHTCDRGKSDWNIFNTNCNKNVLQLMQNDEDEHRPVDSYFVPGIIAQFVAEREENNRISVYWKPGYGAIEKSKLDCFDNEFKWKADYAHDWLLYRLIPYILFLKLPWYEKVKCPNYSSDKFINKFVVENNDIISLKRECTNK